MRFFGRARDSGEVRDLAGVCLVVSGLNYAAFNAALLAEPIESDSNELAHHLQLSASHFDARQLRWTYWMCDDYLARTMRRDARGIFIRHGLRPLTEAPGMYAEGLLPPTRALPRVKLLRVGDDATRAAFAWITSVAFEIPHSFCSAIYGAERAWTTGFHGYVGLVNGSPVATAATVVAADAVGVYSVATLPDYRRLGYAEATMRGALLAAKEDCGIERTVLQSTRSGYSLYEQMGYRKVTTFNVYIAE
jgi:GNAT superfamily N-acetyltransferase